MNYCTRHPMAYYSDICLSGADWIWAGLMVAIGIGYVLFVSWHIMHYRRRGSQKI